MSNASRFDDPEELILSENKVGNEGASHLAKAFGKVGHTNSFLDGFFG